MSNEDLECADDLRERDALVGLPVLSGLCIINEDDEVFDLALEMDPGLGCFSTSHDCGCCSLRGWFWFVCSWRVLEEFELSMLSVLSVLSVCL